MNNDFSENDRLWPLLGIASAPVHNPFFVRNVLRRIRQADPAPFLPISLMRWIRGAAIACLGVAFIVTLTTSRAPLNAMEGVVFDKAAHIDDLTKKQEITLLALLQDSEEPFLVY